MNNSSNSNVRSEFNPLTFSESIRVCLTKYAEFNGRASRSEFWWFMLFVILVASGLSYLSELGTSIFLIAILLPLLAAGTRRLRDSGQSVWWQLFLLAPVGGIIVLGILWALPPTIDPQEDLLSCNEHKMIPGVSGDERQVFQHNRQLYNQVLATVTSRLKMKKSRNRMKYINYLTAMCILLCSACAASLPPGFSVEPVQDQVQGNNPMVHQEGQQIIGPDGNPLKLRGVLLEGWLMWNGSLWGAGFTSETEISSRLEQLVGRDELQKFRKAIYANFITEKDIAMIADLGFNAVRVPINHTVLESEAGEVDYSAEGWVYLDLLLEWGKRHQIYIILDLHSAPGGQSSVFVADPDPEKLWDKRENQDQTVALWRAIASRYHEEEMIAGYDLLNEPGYTNLADLLLLYQRLIIAIREVDPYHMIIIEGNHLTSDFSFFSEPLSSNMAYSFHTYNFLSDEIDESQLQNLSAISAAQGVPLWNGEFGAHKVEWVDAVLEIFEEPGSPVNGWIFWPWKKVTEGYSERWRHLAAIPSTPAWDAVRFSISFPLNEENLLDREITLKGMADFTATINAENLVIDQQMVDTLTKYSR